MNKKEIFLTITLAVLAISLILGPPIEFTTVNGDKYFTITVGLVVALLIVVSFYLIKKVRIKLFKVAAYTISSLLTVCYFYIGLFAIPLAIFSERYPIWEDIAVYKNTSGDLVILQFIEVSGSVHDYRKVKVYKEFPNNIRLSLRILDSNMDGHWTKYNLKDGSQTPIELINGQEKKNKP